MTQRMHSPATRAGDTHAWRQRSLGLLTLLLAGVLACGDRGDSSGHDDSGGLGDDSVALFPLDAPPVTDGSMAPSLFLTETGVAMTWIEPAGDAADTRALLLSRLEGRRGLRRWTPPRTVATGDDFFANWADFPTAAQTAGGAILAHWLQRSGGGSYNYDVALARSIDDGASWTHLGTVHDDGTPTEHGFVSMVPEGDGIRLFWLDGRETAGPESSTAGHDETPRGAMTLRTARVDAGTVESAALLDARVCDCCQTSAVMTVDGPVVAYRDRSPDEIRDISIVRRTKAGWSKPRAVHKDGWRVPGCPVNGPSLAVNPADTSRLAVAWFTASNNEPRVLMALSDNAGRSFGPPIRVDRGAPVGRVAALYDDTGDAIIMWLETEGDSRDASAALLLRRVAARAGTQASAGQAVEFVTTSASRASGFPRLARLDADLVVAWTEGSKVTRVRTDALPFRTIPAVGQDLSTPAAASDRQADHTPGRDGDTPVVPTAAAEPWNHTVGSRAPDYQATSLAGDQVSLTDLRGRPVLLNVWATWCGPCRAEVADLADLHARFATRGLDVIGVSVDEAAQRSRVVDFVSAAQVPYRILLDPDDQASRVFALNALPATFLFDAEGVLAWSRQGVVDRNDPQLLTVLERLVDPTPAD